jgi:hypothetical protein
MDHAELPLLLNSTITTMLDQVVDTYALAGTERLDTTLVVYVDTCAHLSPYSKNGISVCSRYINKDGAWAYVVLAIDHCYHVNSFSEHTSMFQFVPALILKILSNVCLLHPQANNMTTSHFSHALIVIEHNSYDLTETLKNLQLMLRMERPAMLDNMSISCLYHEATRQHVFAENESYMDPLSGKSKTGYVKPGFIMHMHKTDYFRKVFDMMRMGAVSLSQSLTSIYVEPTDNESLQDIVMGHLSNIRAKRRGAGTFYSGKGKGNQDDLAVSVIMSIYIAVNRLHFIWKRIGADYS